MLQLLNNYLIIPLFIKIILILFSIITFGFVLFLLIIFAIGLFNYNKAIKKPKNENFIPRGTIKKVAVIGAGSSGITAAKEAIERGFEVTIFEQTGEIGGNWYFRESESHSSVYRSTFINTSRQLMSYSDFPMSNQLPTYPHHKQIIKYFYDYAKHFGVYEKIKFHTQIIDIKPLDKENNLSKWKIYYRNSTGTPLYLQPIDKLDNNCFEETFDAIMVCNGHHSVPRLPPKFTGQDEFEGQIIHSHQYKDQFNPINCTDKRVVVVGIGNSGVDIANELSRCAKQVYLSTRTGAWIFPKFIRGYAIDHILAETRMLRMLLPEFIMNSNVIVGKLESEVEKHQGSMKSWGLDPKVRITQTHPTVSHELLHRIGNGTIIVKKNIKKFYKDKVEFEDNSIVRADAVIFSTGYYIDFRFIDRNLLRIEDNNVRLYKFIFDPNLPKTIAIIALIQPLGAIMPIAEMQSRFTTHIWNGDIGLPSIDNMNKEIDRKLKKIRKRYLNRARHTIQVDFGSYMDELAAAIGCIPSIFSNLKILRYLLFSPIWPVQYRLNGPSKWKGAAETLKTLYYSAFFERPEREAGSNWIDEENQ
eukprot:TRINITY_DN310_c0_g5_i1.p1 TRINITY_DN310_c0_g5~~TRINITY_DN310_c0_g5_i1.p1  ORF type:complete len:598 (-),score=219.49 TRINITY_DN310_c0_g5_i1:199-1956(-)